ncbi:MAG: MarR family transcriptional regulator [Thermoleophilaceae bacterium]
MLKGQDILVLLKLLASARPPTVRGLAEELRLDPGNVQRALTRLRDSGLVHGRRPQPNRAAAEEFLVHGLRYVFPAREGGPTRGIPTAWAAPPLSEQLAGTQEPPPVWPDPQGRARGHSVEPLHPKAPEAARRDPTFARWLALLDALRLGDGRVRKLAAQELRNGLRAGASGG